jgi:molecular chaperone GrpE
MKNMEEDIKNEADMPQNELAECQKKCDEYLNNWKRDRADFLNYKKDEMERMAFLGKYAREDMILKILPILDSFYLAEKQLPENLKKGEKGSPQAIEWTKGFLQIQNQISEFLKKEGIEEIEVVGKKFNPETMEAVGEAAGGDEGTIVEELQKGYKIGDKVLRPAKVKVTK